MQELQATPGEHFKLHFFGAILELRERLRAHPPGDDVIAALPFLGGYFAELDRIGHSGRGHDAVERWRRDLLDWERATPRHLPIRALREAAELDLDAVGLLFAIGLPDEDPRFGMLFDALQGATGLQRPTVGLLAGWWQDDTGAARAALRRLLDLGVCELTGGTAPRAESAVQTTPGIWDVLRGDALAVSSHGARHVPCEALTAPDDLVASADVLRSLRALPPLLRDGEVRTVVVRGPRGSGRHTLLGAVAAAADRGLLEFGRLGEGEEPPRLAGPLATLLHAVPVVELDLAPAETFDLAAPSVLDGPLGIVLGRQGGIGGDAIEDSVTLTLGLPGRAERRHHWQAGLGAGADTDVDALVSGFRMTGGHIRRTARLARALAAIEGDRRVEVADARRAARSLGREALDTLAIPLPPAGDWSRLAVDEATREDLQLLELRCRHREELGADAAGARNAGVRALLTGPSGTGKTLAARILASTLGRDVYRIDLSTVVNKYIGETEKNLSRVFDRAEELDVALLLDEGDALLTQRTDVQTAHDRYANLETNYLLQRLETFEGILLVTTNAASRIDPAFQRRMDVVIDFPAPDVGERWAIWQLHLPDEHAVDPGLLHEVALRCALTGGQIRNAVVHATLLGLAGSALGSSELEAAVRREYRKAGGVCPLRRSALEAHA